MEKKRNARIGPLQANFFNQVGAFAPRAFARERVCVGFATVPPPRQGEGEFARAARDSSPSPLMRGEGRVRGGERLFSLQKSTAGSKAKKEHGHPARVWIKSRAGCPCSCSLPVVPGLSG